MGVVLFVLLVAALPAPQRHQLGSLPGCRLGVLSGAAGVVGGDRGDLAVEGEKGAVVIQSIKLAKESVGQMQDCREKSCFFLVSHIDEEAFIRALAECLLKAGCRDFILGRQGGAVAFAL